jgi:hypothetical protein
MKWDKPTGSIQQTQDGRYVVMQANSKDWVAYMVGSVSSQDLGTGESDEKARGLCEAHEAQLTAAHRRRA